MKGLRNSLQKLYTLENKYKPQYNPSKDTVVTLISRTYSLLALKIAFSPEVLQYLPLLFSSSWASECRQTVIIFEDNIRKRAEGQSQVWLKFRVASQAPTGKPLSLPTQPRESLLPWQRSHCWKKGSIASWSLWCCFYPVMWTSHLSGGKIPVPSENSDMAKQPLRNTADSPSIMQSSIQYSSIFSIFLRLNSYIVSSHSTSI